MTHPFGFVIVRHVNSAVTNQYWQHNVARIRQFYSDPIVIIDDNSNPEFLDSAAETALGCTVIPSEFPGKGEILGFYYLYTRRLFERALIFHDSCFFHAKIDFDAFTEPCRFLWDFPGGFHEYDSVEGLNYFTQYDPLADTFHNKKDTIRGCFGSQALVTWDFLKKMDDEYGFFNIINYVKNRHERYNIERLFGLVAIHALIYCYDYPPTVWQDISILGDITQYPRWGMSWETYQSYLSSGYDFRDQHDSPARMIKVFSGR